MKTFVLALLAIASFESRASSSQIRHERSRSRNAAIKALFGQAKQEESFRNVDRMIAGEECIWSTTRQNRRR
jgi:hypothetical protein